MAKAAKKTAKKTTKTAANKSKPAKKSTKKKPATKKTAKKPAKKAATKDADILVEENTEETVVETAKPDLEQRGPDRRKVQRRRQIDPTTCERDYSEEEIEFMRAMDEYKRNSGRMFPTCSEILEVVRALGYVRLEGCAQPQFGATVPGEENAESSAANDDSTAGEFEGAGATDSNHVPSGPLAGENTNSLGAPIENFDASVTDTPDSIV